MLEEQRYLNKSKRQLGQCIYLLSGTSLILHRAQLGIKVNSALSHDIIYCRERESRDIENIWREDDEAEKSRMKMKMRTLAQERYSIFYRCRCV